MIGLKFDATVTYPRGEGLANHLLALDLIRTSEDFQALAAAVKRLPGWHAHRHRVTLDTFAAAVIVECGAIAVDQMPVNRHNAQRKDSADGTLSTGRVVRSR